MEVHAPHAQYTFKFVFFSSIFRWTEVFNPWGKILKEFENTFFISQENMQGTA